MTPNSHANHAAVPGGGGGECAGKLPFADCSGQAKDSVGRHLVQAHPLVAVEDNENLDLGWQPWPPFANSPCRVFWPGRKIQRHCGGRASGVAKSQHTVPPSVGQGASAGPRLPANTVETSPSP